MFSLTPAAAQQVQQAAASGQAQELALRVAAMVDAEGSIQYAMGFDEVRDEDLKLDLIGVAVVIAEEHQQILDETVLDFVELQPGEFNFIFIDGRQTSAQSGAAAGCGAGACSSGACGTKGPLH